MQRIIALSISLFAAAHAPAATIFFADLDPANEFGKIRRVETNGAGLDTILDIGLPLNAIGIDPVDQKLYWLQWLSTPVQRADLDGTDAQDIVTSGVVYPSAIAIDHAGGKIYWGDQSDKVAGIYTADLDGNDPQLLISTAFHRGLALDTVNGHIYWSTSISEHKGEIRRANLDGTSQHLVVSDPGPQFKPAAIALDVASSKIYWTDYVLDVVSRSNLAGTGVQTLFIAPPFRNPNGIALDLAAGKVYWGQDIDILEANGKIMRMNLDGSQQELVIDGLKHVASLIVHETPELCAADVVPSGEVDIDDLFGVIGAWGTNNPQFDIAPNGGDGTVGIDDLFGVIAVWGPCP